MPNLLVRIVARVTALLPDHWVGRAGQQFRKTITDVAGTQDLTGAVAEAVSRAGIGLASRDHAEAVKNYAEEEQSRVGAELMKRTLAARTRQENAKADQEESRARIMRAEE